MYLQLKDFFKNGQKIFMMYFADPLFKLQKIKNIYPPKSCFRILVSHLEFQFNF